MRAQPLPPSTTSVNVHRDLLTALCHPPGLKPREMPAIRNAKVAQTLLPCCTLHTPVRPQGDFPPIDTGASYNGASITMAWVGPWSLPASPESPRGVNTPPLLCQGLSPVSPCSGLSAEALQTPSGGQRKFNTTCKRGCCTLGHSLPPAGLSHSAAALLHATWLLAGRQHIAPGSMEAS